MIVQYQFPLGGAPTTKSKSGLIIFSVVALFAAAGFYYNYEFTKRNINA
jgi:hypothetical protein